MSNLRKRILDADDFITFLKRDTNVEPNPISKENLYQLVSSWLYGTSAEKVTVSKDNFYFKGLCEIQTQCDRIVGDDQNKKLMLMAKTLYVRWIHYEEEDHMNTFKYPLVLEDKFIIIAYKIFEILYTKFQILPMGFSPMTSKLTRLLRIYCKVSVSEVFVYDTLIRVVEMNRYKQTHEYYESLKFSQVIESQLPQERIYGTV